MTSVTSRRDRQREDLTDIHVAARRQLEEKGPAGVSWRAIARDVEMSPAALYTYFASLDDLYTALITESFHSLGDAVGRSIDAAACRDVTDRLAAGVAGYREWSLRHPGEFRLIFQNAIPGYVAPDVGPTLAANLEGSAHFLRLLVEGMEIRRVVEAPAGVGVDPSDMNDKFGSDLSPDEMRLAMTCWATFHGLVQLEVNDHVHQEWADTDQVFRATVSELVRLVGGSQAGDDVFDAVRDLFDRTDEPRRSSPP